jgi:hypothetical protein
MQQSDEAWNWLDRLGRITAKNSVRWSPLYLLSQFGHKAKDSVRESPP